MFDERKIAKALIEPSRAQSSEDRLEYTPTNMMKVALQKGNGRYEVALGQPHFSPL